MPWSIKMANREILMQIDKPIRDTAESKPAALEELGELYRYRDLVFQMVRRDIVTRYKRSVLGVAWTMLNPLGMMVILSIVLSQLMPTDSSYPAYILSGLVAWNFFSQSTSAAMDYLIEGGKLLRLIYLPPATFVLTGIGTGLVNLLLSIIPLVVVMVAIGVPLRWTILFAPVSVLILVCFSLGIGLFISSFAVFFRDTSAMYQLILTGWMYLSPVFWPENLLNPEFRFWLYILNPMYMLLRIFRMPLYDGTLPGLKELLVAAGMSLAVLIAGWIFFSVKSDEFTYRI